MVRALAPWLGVLAVILAMPCAAQEARTDAMQPPSSQSAQSATTSLELNSAIERALARNPELAAAAHEVAAAEAATMQADALPNPELEALFEDPGRSARTTTVQINQPIELGGKRHARVEAARRARDVAALELEARRAEVRAAVVAAFFTALGAQERLRIAHASTDLAQRSLHVATRRVQAGKVSPVEETRARIAVSGARVELSQARSEWLTARQQLAAMWGATRPDFERVEGTPDALQPPPDLDTLLARLNDAAAIRRLQHEVQRRDALVDLERAHRYPDLTVSLGAKREEDLGRDQLVVGFAVPLPVFDRNRGNVLEALRRADKAREEETAARARIVAELTNAHTRYAAFRDEVELSRTEILPDAQSAFDAAIRGFEAGKFDFLDVLDAQRTLFQAQSQYFRALAEAHRSAADIDRLLGARLVGGMSGESADPHP